MKLQLSVTECSGIHLGRCLKAACSLRYRVEVLLQAARHAGQQAEVIVHAAAHTLVHERAHRRLLRPGVEQVFGFIVAVHSASCQTILREKKINNNQSILNAHMISNNYQPYDVLLMLYLIILHKMHGIGFWMRGMH